MSVSDFVDFRWNEERDPIRCEEKRGSDGSVGPKGGKKKCYRQCYGQSRCLTTQVMKSLAGRVCECQGDLSAFSNVMKETATLADLKPYDLSTRYVFPMSIRMEEPDMIHVQSQSPAFMILSIRGLNLEAAMVQSLDQTAEFFVADFFRGIH